MNVIVPDSEYIDFSTVPQSKGIGRSALIIVLVGIVMIFVIGGLTIGFASFGHMWPSEKSMRLNMGAMNH